MQVTVECQKRPQGINPRALRRQGLIPAALYGHNGTQSESLIIKEKDAQTLLKKASVNNTLVDVNVPDISWNGKALIREVQAHPWKRNLYHISFFSVATHGKLDITVPLKIVGTLDSANRSGILEQFVTEIAVQCAAEQIPESIDVDISNVNIGDNFYIKDLQLPEGVTLTGDPETVVLALVAPSKTTDSD
jgi:large subunit ribosomal protein L25